jgi:hypothetical protein
MEKKMETVKPRTDQYSKSGLEIKIGKAQIVAMSPEGMKWEGAYNDFGVWNFPFIRSLRDDRLAVSISITHDNVEGYGASGRMFVSSDRGKHWQPIERNSLEEVKTRVHANTFTMLDGEEIVIVSKRPHKKTDIELPQPLNRVGEIHWPWHTHLFYRIGDFPRDQMAMKLFHRQADQTKWTEETSYIDWPEWTIHHYNSDGLIVPSVFAGRGIAAPDGSLLEMDYNIVINETNKALSKWKIICLRSTDRGRTWKFWSEVASLPESEPEKDLFEPAPLFVKGNEMICVIRSSMTRDIDHSMYIVRSTDMGKTWSSLKKITDFGVWPQLLRLKNGVIVLSYGRPGVYLRFSTDNGKTWGSPITTHGRKPKGLCLTEYREIRYRDTCGYTGLLSTDPDKFLLVYADTTHHDEKGDLRKRIVVREIIVKK